MGQGSVLWSDEEQAGVCGSEGCVGDRDEDDGGAEWVGFWERGRGEGKAWGWGDQGGERLCDNDGGKTSGAGKLRSPFARFLREG